MANWGNNSVDATTDPTLTNHTTHTISWDCRDLQGNLVPDGDYQVWIEYTSRNSANGGAPGSSYSITFTKGTEIVNPTIPDEAYFINISLLYEPTGVGINPQIAESDLFAICPNPVIDNFSIAFNIEQPSFVNATIYDMSGRRIIEFFNGYVTDLKYIVNVSSESKKEVLQTGTYILRLNIGGKLYAKKLVIAT